MAGPSEATEERPSEGRGAARSAQNVGSYSETRAWVRRDEKKEPRRRMATKEAARVGIRVWWWLVRGGGCAAGPLGASMPRPRVGDG